MADIMSPSERSARMAAVRQKGTGPELTLRAALHRRGFRFRVNAADLPGSPDLVLPRWGVAVFVHGCFWHGHGCSAGRAPASRQSYWMKKLSDNQRRDARKARALRHLGWHVFTVWSCQLANKALAERTTDKLVRRISGVRKSEASGAGGHDSAGPRALP